ncbi:MAG: hypothetical protein Q4B80_02290 [Aerococcaceae bacterium]|nr:hypothetical protein [Aerococcaceae bacterium]
MKKTREMKQYMMGLVVFGIIVSVLRVFGGTLWMLACGYLLWQWLVD